jgi:uncharacterized membrane protein YjjP (DUF1212 family)
MMKSLNWIDIVLRIIIIGPAWVGGFYLMYKSTGDTVPWYNSIISFVIFLTISTIFEAYNKDKIKIESIKTVVYGNIFLLVFFPAVTIIRNGDVFYAIVASLVFMVGISLYTYLRKYLLSNPL